MMIMILPTYVMTFFSFDNSNVDFFWSERLNVFLKIKVTLSDFE